MLINIKSDTLYLRHFLQLCPLIPPLSLQEVKTLIKWTHIADL